MDPETPEQQIQQVEQILARANELWQQKKADKAFYELEGVTGILHDLVLPGVRQRYEATVSTTSSIPKNVEVQYLYAVAVIKQRIGRYEQAFEVFKMVQQRRRSDILVYKALGDCCVKLDKFEDAENYYKEGLKRYAKNQDCLSALDKAALLAGMGLLKIQTGRYEEALSCIDEAINLSPTNPLFHCYRGNGLRALGQKPLAAIAYIKAKNFVRDPEVRREHRLTNSQAELMERYIERLENETEKNKGEEQNEVKEENVQQLEMNTANETQKEEIKKFQEMTEKIKFLEDENNEEVYDYYDGFRYTMHRTYQVATTIEDGGVFLPEIETGDSLAKIACQVALLVPLVGSNVSLLIDPAENKTNKAEIVSRAINVTNFAPDEKDLSELVQDAISELAVTNCKALISLQPENYILPEWESSMMGSAIKQLPAVKESIYGTRFQTPMQRLGYKHAIELIANEIATGKIYGTKPPPQMPFKEKKAKLIEYAQKILDADLANADKKYEEKNEPVPEDKSKCTLT